MSLRAPSHRENAPSDRDHPALRICLVSEEEEGWGGIGTYTAVLARALRDVGHAVHVVLRGWEGEGEGESRERADGVELHRVVVPEPTWRRGSERIVARLYSAREALLWSRGVGRCVRSIAAQGGLDVVEVPEYRGAGALLAASRRLRLAGAHRLRLAGAHRLRLAGAHRLRLAGACGAPRVVVRLHTPAFLTERANEQRADALDRRAVELLERFAVRRADLLTAPSAAVARAVAERWGFPAGRVSVVPNPIDEQLFSPSAEGRGLLLGSASEGQRRPFGSPSDAGGERKLVLCVGRLERVKGVDVLVEALPQLLERHPDARVVLVGEDDAHGYDGGSMRAHLRRRAQALGVPEHALDIRGAVPRNQLPALSREAAVCVVPSRWENLPYACIEAMGCGRPVVVSRVGGLTEAVSDGVDGLLVAPGDPAALAGAIARLLDDRALAERLGASARATVMRRFAAPAVAAQMADLYAQVGWKT